MAVKSLEDKVKSLPPELKKEVNDFLDFLLSKKTAPRGEARKPGLRWIGGLKEYGKKYTSLDLQKRALEWRD